MNSRPDLPWRCEPTRVFRGTHSTEWSIFDAYGRRVARVQAAGGSAAEKAKAIVTAINAATNVAAPEFEYVDAMDELTRRAKSGEIPPGVTEALAHIFEHPDKLFCVKPDVRLADGSWAVSPVCKLQASDLLVKLVLAVRAFDWECIVAARDQVR